MNCIRLICREGDEGSLSIKSTLAQTILLPNRLDENIDFDDQDLVIIKNERQDATKIRLAQFNPRRGQAQHANLTSSRHENRSGRIQALDSGGDEVVDWILEGGEALIIKASTWRHPHGLGNMGPPQ
jgi:hypothetical protein